MTILRSYSSSLSLEQKFKSTSELPELCSAIAKTLFNGNSIWDNDRSTHFNTYCDILYIQFNFPPTILYTSLKYLQLLLINSTNEYNIIDLSHLGQEFSIYTVCLELAYKYHDDSPPSMKEWSCVSMVPLDQLVVLETFVLEILDYSLTISFDELNVWVEQCNTIYDIQLVSPAPIDCVDIFDLHNTKHRLGFNTLLPVILSYVPATPETIDLTENSDEAAMVLDQFWYLTSTTSIFL